VTLLILGAGGQLGTELRALSKSLSGELSFRDHAALDVGDARAVERALGELAPAIVVNAAAYTDVERAEEEFDAARRVNVEGAGVVAGACARAGATLIHISTDYVFDGRKAGSYVEDDPVNPLGVYARTKAEGEIRVRDAGARHVVLRSSWLYGIHGRNFLKTILKRAGEGRELRVVADQFGCPTGTQDLAQAILRVADAIQRGEKIWGTYHFAGTGSTSWHRFAERIVDEFATCGGRRVPVIPVSSADYGSKVPRPRNSALDSSKFAAVFGLRAQRWEERTANVVASLLSVRRKEDVA
jgi:dTDP-4-dehydrorhamnose reductase